MAKRLRPLRGQVVAITGGARGIGKATAAALVAHGARVAIGDIDAALAARTAEELGHGTIGLPLDVTDRASFAAFLDQVQERRGPLDVLVNNAGIMPVGPFEQESDAVTRRQIEINLYGVIIGSKLAVERFLPRGRGHLVNMASIAGKAGAVGGATYSATKHAVVGLSDSIRQEFGPSGISVSVIMPIGVNTELYSGLQQLRFMKTPEPEDVAASIVQALQTGRFQVFVPQTMGWIVRFGGLLPPTLYDAVAKLLGSGNLLTAPDRVARAAYDARLASVQPAPADGSAAAPEQEAA